MSRQGCAKLPPRPFACLAQVGDLRFASAPSRELEPRRKLPLHVPTELAIDDLADGVEQPRAAFRWQCCVI